MSQQLQNCLLNVPNQLNPFRQYKIVGEVSYTEGYAEQSCRSLMPKIGDAIGSNGGNLEVSAKGLNFTICSLPLNRALDIAQLFATSRAEDGKFPDGSKSFSAVTLIEV